MLVDSLRVCGTLPASFMDSLCLQLDGLSRVSNTISLNLQDAKQSERRVSGRVGVPPSTRRTSLRDAPAINVRMYSAGRGIRRAGRPPYPRHAVLLALPIFARD